MAMMYFSDTEDGGISMDLSGVCKNPSAVCMVVFCHRCEDMCAKTKETQPVSPWQYHIFLMMEAKVLPRNLVEAYVCGEYSQW